MTMILTGGRPGRLDVLRSALFEQCHIRADGDWLLMDYWVCTWKLFLAQPQIKGACRIDIVKEIVYLQYGRHLHLIILCVALSVMGADFIIAISLGALTYRELLRTKHVSPHLRSLQFKLLFAVSAQVSMRYLYHRLYRAQNRRELRLISGAWLLVLFLP